MRISTTQGGQQINVLRDVPRPAGDAETLVSSSSKERRFFCVELEGGVGRKVLAAHMDPKGRGCVLALFLYFLPLAVLQSSSLSFIFWV